MDVSVFMIGFCGGILGGIALCLSYYSLICSKTRQYMLSRHVLKDSLVLAGLEQEIHDIKNYLNAMNEEYYKNAKKL